MARPAVALIALVPVRVVVAESEMVWVDCDPVVTTFSSGSTMSTTTSEPKVRSLSAVVGAETIRALASPWVSSTL